MATDVKNQIAETFKKHAGKAGIDKVTINAIVTDCKISRQAFYYYFQDIVDVARYVLRENLKEMMKRGEAAEEPKKAVQLFAEDLVQQFPVFSLVFNSKLRGELEILLIRELREFFCMIFLRWKCGIHLSREQIEFQSDMIACGVTAYAFEHCNEPHFDAAVFSSSLWEMLQKTYGEE